MIREEAEKANSIVKTIDNVQGSIKRFETDEFYDIWFADLYRLIPDIRLASLGMLRKKLQELEKELEEM